MNEEDPRRFINAVTTHWLHALWLTLITTGLRKGEVPGLVGRAYEHRRVQHQTDRSARARKARVRGAEDETIRARTLLLG
jgi:hypothetical protein